MNRDSITDTYRRMLTDNFEIVTVRRYLTGSGANRPKFDVEVKARVMGFSPDELVGQVQQGDRKVIMLAKDLIDAQFSIPIKASDKVVVRGRECAIIAPDDSTRRLGTTIIAYELVARG